MIGKYYLPQNAHFLITQTGGGKHGKQNILFIYSQNTLAEVMNCVQVCILCKSASITFEWLDADPCLMHVQCNFWIPMGPVKSDLFREGCYSEVLLRKKKSNYINLHRYMQSV